MKQFEQFFDYKVVKGVSKLVLKKSSFLTVAPELDPDNLLIKTCRDRNISVSLGHSMATLEEGKQALKSGATLVTHLFNAMNAFHHRDPGLALVITTDIFRDMNAYYGIIADGIHIHEEVVKLAYKANPEKMCLITDAISPLGLQDGQYHCGQQSLEVKGTRAVLFGTETLIGAICPMWTAVQNLHDWTQCSWAEALQAASLHPARALRIDKSKGTLNFNSDADFLILRLDNFELLSTWIAGECAFDISEATKN